MRQSIILNPKTAEKAGLLKAGTYFAVYIPETGRTIDIYVPNYWSNRLDLKNMIVYSEQEADEHPELPTLNDLARANRLIEKTIYLSHDICPKGFDYADTAPQQLPAKVLREILKEFNENGFKVTRKSVLHNFNAWLCDFKSGYRDEQNGYHLFTPCGCNPLSLRATSLDNRLDWQTTYTC